MKTFLILIFLLTVYCILAENNYAQKKQVQISFCKPSLPEQIKQVNATFTNYYFFRIDANNRPIKFRKLSGVNFINNDEVETCVNSWSFKNFSENTSFVVQIGWQHGYGWQPITIRSKDYSKTIKPH